MMHFILSLLLTATPSLVQEPNPPSPQAQEKVTEQMIIDAILRLRESYDQADERVRTGVESDGLGAQERGHALEPAEQALSTLVANMEELLALLPDPPSSSKNPQNGKGKPQSSPSEGNQPQGGQPNQDKPDDSRTEENQKSGNQEADRGQATPPDSALLNGQMPPAYARWGLLPPRLQEALRSMSASEVPLRYRRWLEEYHRRGAQPR